MPAPAPISPLRSGVAALLAGLVFALGLLAWMPDVHARLHHPAADHACCTTHEDASPAHSAPEGDGGCVVTLFAQGLPTPVAAPVPLPPRVLAETILPAAPQAAPAPAPDRLHPPALAPPATV